MISIIVPTRDRPASLQRTLDGLAAMTVPDGVTWEIIVVDNGRLDLTRAVIARYAAASGLRVHHLHEGHPGVSRARNRGMQVARGEILAFTDDDMVVDPAWLAHIHREFSADPTLGMLTGRVILRLPDGSERPVRGGTDRETFGYPANPRRAGSGGHMALRASVAARVGSFDERLGPGISEWGGEDVDYIYRALKAGYTVLYSPQFLAYHERSATRPNRLPYGMGAVLAKHALRGDRWMAGLLVAMSRRFLGAVFGRGVRHRALALRKLLALYGGAFRWIGLEAGGWVRSLWTGRPH
ncbi:MAG: glycosyltransferase [Armatimonadota bacterium]|nr:glycosyltransferase [Armatimonadota bacterium]